jgi:hypothetical protein
MAGINTGNQELDNILQSIQTTSELQFKAISQIMETLKNLADRLEPLSNILEHQAGAQDAQAQNQERVTMALVKLQQQQKIIVDQMRGIERKEQDNLYQARATV